jgi:Spy/CpxP family protein refolding chaperone
MRPIRALPLLLAASLATAPLVAAPLAAQEPAADDGAQAATLRQRIEDRLAARVQEELGLTDDQVKKLRVTTAEYAERRREMQQREQELRRALAGQLRPGVAANQDSVSRLTSDLVDAKIALAETYRDELKALTYLTPVQRAQFFALRERLLQRMQEIREQRQADGVGGGALRRRLR